MTRIAKYTVKDSYRFNLDSMLNKVWCMIYDIQDGEYDSVELMGKTMSLDDLYDFKEELYDLIDKAYGRVTGKEYGRIKEISDERNMLRYFACIASGMSEDKAGNAFLE